MDKTKPPLTPKWAIILSLFALVGAWVLAVVYRLLAGVSAARLLGFVAGCFVCFAWAGLERRSYRIALRATEVFAVLAVVVLAALVVVQEEGEAFPRWATAVLIVGGVGCCAVIGGYGARNFVWWIRGELDARTRAAVRPTKPGEVYLPLVLR